MATFDTVVVGLGAVGSATALELARRGERVVGIDRYRPPHAFGSSHGSVRLTRQAYYEHPLYVPLVRRSNEIWEARFGAVGAQYRVTTGSLMIGAPESQIVRGAVESATVHGVEHSVLTATQMAAKFPALVPPSDFVGVHEPGSGLLHAEAIVAQQLEAATAHGAAMQYGVAAVDWRGGVNSIRILTDRGELHARRAVLCTGAWMPVHLQCEVPLVVERQVQHWLTPIDALGGVGSMPVSMWELEDGRVLYCMTDVGGGVKVGWHHGGVLTTADTVDRTVHPDETRAIVEAARRYLPGIAGPQRAAEVCLYTNTPDGHFVIDRHPKESRVVVVSACSGHGFKFSAAVGEIAADLVQDRHPAFDIEPFRIARLLSP